MSIDLVCILVILIAIAALGELPRPPADDPPNRVDARPPAR